MKRIENKDQEIKKIVIVEVPYKRLKEYFANREKDKLKLLKLQIRGEKIK